MQEVDLHAVSERDLARLLGHEPAVVLVGSGVSIWEPTALPTGCNLCQGTFNALFRTPGMPKVGAEDEAWLEKWFMGRHDGLPPMPFEVIMERCPNHDALGTLLSSLYSEDRANPVHECLARLAGAGRFHSLITTNYDCGLDTALRATGAPLARIVRRSDQTPTLGRIYFKIHGTAEKGCDDTLIYRLRAEGALPEWKRHVLQGVIRDRALLIIGYSGADFDICPEIPAAGPRLVLWNFRTADDLRRSPGWSRLGEHGVPRVSLVGDMLRLLELIDQRIPARRASNSIDVAKELRSRFSPHQLLLWRARVLNSMGHARLASDAMAPLIGGAVPRFEAERERAQATFHAGAYLSSARLFLVAASLAEDERSRRLTILDASDAARCYGDLQWAERLITEGADCAGIFEPWYEELTSVRDVKRILVYRDRYEIAGLLRRTAVRTRIREDAAPLFERAARAAIVSGRWYEFQQLSLWAERMSVNRNRIQPPGLYAPSPAHLGYRQLGYPVGLAMEVCDRARHGCTRRDELEYFLALMEMFGCAPQAWKVALALALAHPTSARRAFTAFVRNFGRCEYTMRARAVWLLRRS